MTSSIYVKDVPISPQNLKARHICAGRLTTRAFALLSTRPIAVENESPYRPITRCNCQKLLQEWWKLLRRISKIAYTLRLTKRTKVIDNLSSNWKSSTKWFIYRRKGIKKKSYRPICLFSESPELWFVVDQSNYMVGFWAGSVIVLEVWVGNWTIFFFTCKCNAW